MAGENFWDLRKPVDSTIGHSDDKKEKEAKKQEIESIKIVENSVKEKYKSIPQFNEVIKETKSCITENSKSWRLLYYKILKNLDTLDPQIFKGSILRVIDEIFNIVNANIKEENSKQINDIKSKLTKFKNSLKETKEQLEENLYQKLKQFSITYDRSLINEYFADFQVKWIEARLKRSKNPQKMEKGLRSLARLRTHSKIFSFSEKQISNLLWASEIISEQDEAKQKMDKKEQGVTQNSYISLTVREIHKKVEDTATSISNNTSSNYNPQQNGQINTNVSQQNKTDSNVKAQQNGPSPQQNNQIIDDKNQHDEDKKERILDNKENVTLEKYLLYWETYDNEKTCEWTSLKHAFILKHSDWLKWKTLSPEELDKKYLNWKNSRLKDIIKLFNKDDIESYAKRKQIKQLNWLDSEETGIVLNNMSDSEQSFDNDVDAEAESLEKFSCYTSWEILWELLLHIDKIPDWFSLLQRFASSTAQGQKLFDEGHITWEWNDETQFLLQKALNDPIFIKADANANWNYSKKINEILKKHEPLKDVSYLEKYFQSLSEVQKRETAYWKDPEWYWRAQTLEWPREFVWISDLWNWSSYKLEEQSFLNSHMQEFNGKLTEFLKIPQLKEWNPINETAKTKMEQIWKTIPLEQINAIYNLFASKPEEQEKFNNFLKENNLPNIDINDVSLKRSVLEQDYSFNPIAKYCYERIWISCQNEIISESWKTLQYLSDKTWDTALNIKNKVLEFFLPWISIRPEKAENGIFYFRDENNLDTLYSFNPENWEISQQGNISLEDEGIISFRSWWSKGNLLQKIQWFQNIVDIDLLDILPDKNPGNMEELENQILNKIQSKIAVEKVADTSVVNKELLRLKNERNVCYNGIVWDLKQLLNIEDDYLYETSWENYKIFFNLLKTFERIDIEYPNDNKPLNSMKLLLDKICDSTESFTLLKPSLLENNREWDASEEISQENTDWEIQHSQKVSRGPHIIKNLIDPNTQLFDINLINDLAYNGEIDQYLAERKYDRIIAVIQKNKELKIAEQEYEKEVAQLYNSTRDELHWLNEDIELFANINSLENEGYFLS